MTQTREAESNPVKDVENDENIIGKNREKTLSSLKEKSKAGIANVLDGFLSDPGVQKVISKTIVKQSLETGVFLSFLIVGVTTLINAAKSALNLSWQVDVGMGMSLLVVGAVYVIKKLR